MQKLLAALCCIAMVGVIVLGEYYWNNNITNHAEANSITQNEEEPYDEAVTQESYDIIYTLPVELQDKAKEAIQNNETLKVVIYGSEDVALEDGSWTDLLENKLSEAYGDLFDVHVFSEEEKTTTDVVQEGLHEKVVDLAPDILLLEAFLLKDNGIVGVDNTIANIETIVEEVRDAQPEVTVYFLPSYPIFTATYYPRDVEAFENYAHEQNERFLNHWEAWTEQDDALYLEEEKDRPTEVGHQVWAKYFIDYFIQE